MGWYFLDEDMGKMSELGFLGWKDLGDYYEKPYRKRWL